MANVFRNDPPGVPRGQLNSGTLDGAFQNLTAATGLTLGPLAGGSYGSDTTPVLRGLTTAGTPTYTCRFVLEADTSDSIAVPSGATKVRFSSADNFYARPNTTVPALADGNVEDGTAGELNPARWNLRSAGSDGAVTAIHLRAVYADTEITLSFFRD